MNSVNPIYKDEGWQGSVTRYLLVPCTMAIKMIGLLILFVDKEPARDEFYWFVRLADAHRRIWSRSMYAAALGCEAFGLTQVVRDGGSQCLDGLVRRQSRVV